MYCSSWCVLTFVLACYRGSSPIAVSGADVRATNEAVNRYMADASKHTVETSGEHREKELEAFLKTGKVPKATLEPKKKGVNTVVVEKMKNVPTEVLVKQFIGGGSHIEQHFAAEGRGRGPDKTISPSIAGKGNGNETVAPSKSPKEGKSKKQKGKRTKNSHTKAPKDGKKIAKKIKDGKKGHASDYPSSSPTPTSTSSSPLPTLPLNGDVTLPPNIEAVEHGKGNEDNGNKDNEHDVAGRSTDGTAHSDSDVDSSSPSSSSSIAKIVSPLAAFAGLLVVAGILISRRQRPKDENDQNENLMKHTREGFDVESGTVSGNTYRTGAFTEDDGTLEESVDVLEENQRNIACKNHAKEMVRVVNELEEVSLNDDGASTTSVSSGSHSPSNSCDGSLIEAARAAMTAEAFQPDKSKVYDSSVKPEWATRTSVNAVAVVPSEAILNSQEEDATTVQKSSEHDTEEIEASERNNFDAPKSEENISEGNNDSTPAWMKTHLRPVSANESIPTSEVFSGLTSGVDTEPEWMKKFKQMGLEKKE